MRIGEPGWEIEYNRINDDKLRVECTDKRINWDRESPVHGSWAEWKRYVGPHTRGIWHSLSDDQKFAIAKDALEHAKDDSDWVCQY